MTIESHITQVGETFASIAEGLAPGADSFADYLAESNGHTPGADVGAGWVLWYDTDQTAPSWDPVTYDWTQTGARLDNPEIRTGRLRLGGPYPTIPGLAVLENVSHTDPSQEVRVDGADIVIRNFETNSSIRVFPESTAVPVIIEHSTIKGEATSGIHGFAMTVRHCDITSINDGLNPGQGGSLGEQTLIEYNYIHRPGPQEGTRHHDGIQLWQGGNVTIRRNRILGFHTSAVLVKSDKELAAGDGPIDNVLIEENWMGNSHGFYANYVRHGSRLGQPTNVTIRNNAYDRDCEPVNAGPSPTDQGVFVRTEEERTNPEWIVFDGNYYADNGEEIVPPGGWYVA